MATAQNVRVTVRLAGKRANFVRLLNAKKAHAVAEVAKAVQADIRFALSVPYGIEAIKKAGARRSGTRRGLSLWRRLLRFFRLKRRRQKKLKRFHLGRRVDPGSSFTGQPPRLRTGALRRGIILKLSSDKLEARVGWHEKVPYGYFHERGIRYRQAGFMRRPHLQVTFEKNKPNYARLFLSMLRRA